MRAFEENTLLKQWILSILLAIFLLALLFLDASNLSGTASVARCFILSLCSDTGNIIGIANMEDLYSCSGLLHNYHHLLVGVRSDEGAWIHLTYEKSFVLRQLLSVITLVKNLIKCRQAKIICAYCLNVLEGSKNNDHEERVVNEAALGKYLHILL